MTRESIPAPYEAPGVEFRCSECAYVPVLFGQRCPECGCGVSQKLESRGIES